MTHILREQKFYFFLVLLCSFFFIIQLLYKKFFSKNCTLGEENEVQMTFDDSYILYVRKKSEIFNYFSAGFYLLNNST